MSDEKIDVLAVMDRAARELWVTGQPVNPIALDLISARAAMAKLIESDEECDAIGAELRSIDNAGPRHNSYGTGWELRDRAHRKEVEARFDAACVRRANALARIGATK